jgi:hypothetical protein
MTITLTREEAQQVLDALEKISMGGHPDWANDVIPILRAQLSQPEPEPIAWMSSSRHIYHSKEGAKFDGVDKVAPVYVHPPRREWQGLTDAEAEQIVDDYWHDVDMFIEVIEAKLKEKNT